LTAANMDSETLGVNHFQVTLGLMIFCMPIISSPTTKQKGKVVYWRTSCWRWTDLYGHW